MTEIKMRLYRIEHCCVCGKVIKAFSVICDACSDWYADVVMKSEK